MPIRQDVLIWQGNNSPELVWELPEAMPIEGSSFFLSVVAGGVALLASDTVAGTLMLDPDLRQLRWPFTAAQSRRIPRGKVASYEIERRIESLEVTEFYGSITGIGGVNGDAGSPGPDATELDFSRSDMSALQLLGWI